MTIDNLYNKLNNKRKDQITSNSGYQPYENIRNYDDSNHCAEKATEQLKVIMQVI